MNRAQRKHRVVEMGRHDDDAVELSRLRETPAAHRKRIVANGCGRAHGASSACSSASATHGTRRTCRRRPHAYSRSGTYRSPIFTVVARSSILIRSSASPASSAAPRALARIGCSTCTDLAVEHVGHDRGTRARDCAPPPMKCSDGNGRPTNFSTVSSNQRLLYATPSSTERTSSARVVASDRLCQPARNVWSSTGVRSPFSHGVKITPLLPGGTAPASASSAAQVIVGRQRLFAQPIERSRPRPPARRRRSTCPAAATAATRCRGRDRSS